MLAKTGLTLPDTTVRDISNLTPRFSLNDLAAAADYYEQQGYVVLQGILPTEQCDAVRATFTQQVRRSRTPILRQKNMRYERNAFTKDGFLSNPIFNVQDLDPAAHGTFRAAVLDVLTAPAVAHATATLLGGERTKVIQSMFFEAPAGTWAHQDSYYQDSAAKLGGCVAGWFALEDIDEAAGRFYVCPGSHRSLPTILNAGALNFADGHDAYKIAVGAAIEEHGLTLRAPALAKGDVLFWNSLTVHGSFMAGAPGFSRTSLTAHYLRDSDSMLQFHSRIREQRMMEWNGTRIGLLHEQSRLKNRLMREAGYRWPETYARARRLALKALLASRGLRRPSRAIRTA